MGKCETSTASLGIKILISDLISQINLTNVEIIKDILFNGFIEDSNAYYNNSYSSIIVCNELQEKYLDLKNHLENEFKKKDLNNVTLWDQTLLLPIKNILETDRYGYDRYGKNGKSIDLDYDLITNLNLDKYKDITNYTIVFILSQYSG